MTIKAGRVAGKQALITGAAGGLGEAMAWMLAREGARVAVTDVNLAGAQALAGAINAEVPGAAFAFAHDVVFVMQAGGGGVHGKVPVRNGPELLKVAGV